MVARTSKGKNLNSGHGIVRCSHLVIQLFYLGLQLLLFLANATKKLSITGKRRD